MPNLYAFDVDDTLELSGGPVPMAALWELRAQGHIVGLCGNWALVTRKLPDWHRLCAFIGPMQMTKATFLKELSTHVPADEFIMVGNDPAVFGNSNDRGAAAEAGWRFIREHDFAAGAR